MRLQLQRISDVRSTKRYSHSVEPRALYSRELSRWKDPIEWWSNGWTEECTTYLPDGRKWVVQIGAELRELKGWLRNYVTAHPEEALPMLVEMLQIVVDSQNASVSE